MRISNKVKIQFALLNEQFKLEREMKATKLNVI